MTAEVDWAAVVAGLRAWAREAWIRLRAAVIKAWRAIQRALAGWRVPAVGAKPSKRNRWATYSGARARRRGR